MQEAFYKKHINIKTYQSADGLKLRKSFTAQKNKKDK
jgi:hypothetical protein